MRASFLTDFECPYARRQLTARNTTLPAGSGPSKLTAAALGWEATWTNPPDEAKLLTAKRFVDEKLPRFRRTLSPIDLAYSMRSERLFIAAVYLMDKNFAAQCLGLTSGNHNLFAGELMSHGEEFAAEVIGLVLHYTFTPDYPKAAFFSSAISLLFHMFPEKPGEAADFLKNHQLQVAFLNLANDDEATSTMDYNNLSAMLSIKGYLQPGGRKR